MWRCAVWDKPFLFYLHWLLLLFSTWKCKEHPVWLPKSNTGQVKQTRVPVASGRGESGRESVGDGVPTARLLLLLLRALQGEEKQKSAEKTLKQWLTCVFYQHSKQSRKKINSQPINSSCCSCWRKTEIAVIRLIMVFTHTHTCNAATGLCVNINTHTPVESMRCVLHKANSSALKATLGSCRGL